MLKKIIIFFVSIFLIIPSLFYYSDSGYDFMQKVSKRLPYGSKIMTRIDNVMNELDFMRAVKRNSTILSENQIVSLKFSSSDMRDLNNNINDIISSEKPFISDKDKQWRKAQILYKNNEEKIKYKLHGTAVTPYKEGSFSLRIKHSREGNYLDKMREYTLITSKDEPDINTMIVNNFANSMGLYSPENKLVLLKINGVEIGLFTLFEHYDKEWFERKMNLTNYVSFKSNDDWDTKTRSFHFDDTDLFSEDKEVGGTGNKEIALNALDSLFDAIKSNNLDQIERLIDIDYLAKFLAYLSIINNSHQISGDNLKYIYDLTTGKFRFIFRLESDRIIPIQDFSKINIEFFNDSIFNSRAEYIDIDTHKLFKILIKNYNFREIRDKHLLHLINNKTKFFDFIEKQYEESNEVVFASNVSRQNFKYKKNKFIENIKNNFDKAEKYLSYSKIYISQNNDLNDNYLSIINDSYSKTAISQIELLDSKNESIFIDSLLYLDAPNLNDNFKMIHRKQIIQLPKDLKFKSIRLRNSITNKDILSDNIYFNSILKYEYYDYNKSISSIDQNNLKYEIINNSIFIKRGKYQIFSDIIFPYGYNVHFEAGTNMSLAKNISILIQGSFEAIGEQNNPIIVKAKDLPYGTFAINGNLKKNSKVYISNFIIGGGFQDIVQGVDYTGQFSIHGVNDVYIADSIIEDSSSDDGINIKNANVEIKKSIFRNNFGDQIDLDYCKGVVNNNKFIFNSSAKKSLQFNDNRDGLDISGSIVKISKNTFENLSDKGISVGEKSVAIISNNLFKENNIAVEIKDASKVYELNNEFNNNTKNYNLYLKKAFYNDPMLFVLEDSPQEKISIINGSINFFNEMENIFEQ